MTQTWVGRVYLANTANLPFAYYSIMEKTFTFEGKAGVNILLN